MVGLVVARHRIGWPAVNDRGFAVSVRPREGGGGARPGGQAGPGPGWAGPRLQARRRQATRAGSSVSSARRTRPWPASMSTAAASAAAAPYANVAQAPNALQSRPPTVLAAKAARPVAV